MSRLNCWLLALGICLSACSSEPEPQLRIEAVRLPAPPPGAEVAAVYLTVQNPTGRDDSLVAVSSPQGAVEVHAMVMTDDHFAMRPSGPVPVPAGGQVVFESGGLHLMLRDLKAPLAAGDTVELHFNFASGAAITVTAPVVAP